ncbi:MAG TPA: pirin family protein [Thermoanaerobaculia bacterium]|nr:pirin family protein [Thermoanaerobaculia bacterium]
MTGIRRIARVIEPMETMDGAGVRLRRSIATPVLDYLDPFLLLDHFGSDDPNEYMAGFPMHPHRGIETVTYMLDGVVAHRDTMGHSGEVGPGDIQWMSAGGGLQHEEMPRIRKGKLEGFQLWVNLPAKLKMSKPDYQEVANPRIPEVAHGNAKIRIVAGKVGDVAGAITDIAANPTYLDVALPHGERFEYPVPKGHAAFAYVFRGEAVIDGRTIAAPKLVVLDDGDSVEVRAGNEGTRFLLVSGKPLNEPVARYGPFVMNTRQEIGQALEDLRRGCFEWRS